MGSCETLALRAGISKRNTSDYLVVGGEKGTELIWESGDAVAHNAFSSQWKIRNGAGVKLSTGTWGSDFFAIKPA